VAYPRLTTEHEPDERRTPGAVVTQVDPTAAEVQCTREGETIRVAVDETGQVTGRSSHLLARSDHTERAVPRPVPPASPGRDRCRPRVL